MWLLVGGDSEIGAAAYRSFKRQRREVAATTRRPQHVDKHRPFLDLAASLENWEPPPQTRAACVFAGIARLAACHADPIGSAHVNVCQTLSLIGRLIDRGIHVLFLSSNQVFDGHVPHVPPEASPCPVSEYGRQKAQTEAGLRAHIRRAAPVAILRLAKVVSPHMPLICSWIERLMAGEPIKAFHDMTMAPAPADLVVAAISALLDDQARGIFQLTGPRDVPYAEVGRFVAEQVGADPDFVSSVSAREAGLPEGAAPRHTTLDSSIVCGRYGITIPDVWEVIETIDHRLHGKRKID